MLIALPAVFLVLLGLAGGAVATKEIANARQRELARTQALTGAELAPQAGTGATQPLQAPRP